MRPPRYQLLYGLFRWLFRRTVRGGLRGVWLRGALPQGGAVLAANHHSWWDAYVLPVLLFGQPQGFGVVMGEARLSEFGFFRELGGISASRPRLALAALKRGETLLIFPEGELRSPGGLGPLNEGAAWLARKAGVPLVPVAIRVVLRGQEFPEAYLEVGPPLPPETERLSQALQEMLADLDRGLRTAPAEEPLPGFRPVLKGRLSTHERMAGWGAALRRLMGVR